MQKISRRLQAIRAQMLEMDLAALIIPRADEYLGEYIPEHNRLPCHSQARSRLDGMNETVAIAGRNVPLALWPRAAGGSRRGKLQRSQ
jgi:hypothetical protein